MGKWKGAWFLVRSELLWARWKFLVPILFAGYMLLFMVPFVNDGMEGGGRVISFVGVDLYALLLFPCLGLMGTQANFYWRSDMYTMKLEVWRTLPIPIRQIVLGRYLLYVTISLPSLLLFFTGYYFAMNSLDSGLELGAFLQFALFWIVYTMIISFFYLYVELGYKGKTYFWYCMVVTLAAFGLIIGLTIWTETSLFINSYNTVQNGGWWLPAAAIVAALILIPFFLHQTEKRLRVRNLAK